MPQVLANVCFLGLIAGFSALCVLNPDAFYVQVQEDQPLEWSTVWAFIVASAFFARAAFSQRRERPLPYTGELVEGGMALAFLFASVASKWKLGGDDIGVIFRVRKEEALSAENER